MLTLLAGIYSLKKLYALVSAGTAAGISAKNCHAFTAGAAANGRLSSWLFASRNEFEAVIIATYHHAVSYQELADWTSSIVDTRNAMTGVKTKPGQMQNA